MGTGHHNQDNLVTWFQSPYPMNDQRVVNVPAVMGFSNDLVEGLLSHARVVFQGHPAYLGSVIDIAHQTDKTRHGPDGLLAPRHGGHFTACVEICRLHPDRHVNLPSRGGNRQSHRRPSTSYRARPYPD